MSSIIEECFNDGFAEINGRKYVFCEVNHRTRLKIFGYAQSVRELLSVGQFSFMGTKEYFEIEDLMFSNMTYDNDSLKKMCDKHFREHGEDYINVVNTSLRVFCYPFMRGTN